MPPRDEPTYGLEIRIAERSTEIALVPHVRGADGRLADVWSRSFRSVDEAGRLLGLMVKCRREWGRWGRMAGLLGSGFLDGVMDGDLLTRASPRLWPRREDRPTSSERPSPPRRRNAIRMSLSADGGSPCISGSHDGRPFMELVLPTAVEARRVWDWLRWQTERYRSMFELSEREGTAALVLQILARVLAAERRAASSPGARDPERPLRHWRPVRHVGDLYADDGGSDEAYG